MLYVWGLSDSLTPPSPHPHLPLTPPSPHPHLPLTAQLPHCLVCCLPQELQEGCAELDPLRREAEELSAQLAATEDELKVWRVFAWVWRVFAWVWECMWGELL